jgi:hypothetical protein
MRWVQPNETTKGHYERIYQRHVAQNFAAEKNRRAGDRGSATWRGHKTRAGSRTHGGVAGVASAAKKRAAADCLQAGDGSDESQQPGERERAEQHKFLTAHEAAGVARVGDGLRPGRAAAAVEGALVMETLINRLFELSGPMPDPAAHRHYLAGLHQDELQARADALTADRNKPRFGRADTGAMRATTTVNLSR